MADFTTLRGQSEQLRLAAMHGPDVSTGERRQQYAAFLWLAQQPQGQVILTYLAQIVGFTGVATAVQLSRIVDGGSDPVKQAAKAQVAVAARHDEIWLQEGVRWLVREIFEKIREAPAVLQQEQG